MSLLAGVMNPGVQAAQQRLAMTSTAAPAAAAPATATTAVAAPADASATPDGQGSNGAAQATLGADQLTPPDTKKILLGSVLRGAMTGASLMFGVNKFVPAGSGIANFMLKALKFLPFLKTVDWPLSVGIALGAGAVVGGIIGLIGGIKKAKSAATTYATAMQQQQAAAAQQAPVGDPLVVGPDGKPVAVDPATGQPAATAAPAPASTTAPPADTGTATAAATKSPAKRAKRNPVMGNATPKKSSVKHPAAAGHHGRSGGGYLIKRGDTLWALSHRWGVSIEAIMRANPKITNRNLIYTGDSLVVPG